MTGMTEKFYLAIYVISLLIIGIATMITGETYGEAKDVNIDAAGIFVLLIVYLLTYAVVYRLYKKTQYNMPRFKRFPILEINKRRIHSFIFVCLIICIFGTLLFDIGKVKGTVTTSYSMLISLIKVSEFFPIYYISARDKKKKIYWINIILYAVMKSLQGWTGWILIVAVLEIFMRLKQYKGWLKKIFNTFKSKIMAIIAIVAGGFVYYFASPLKNSIRYGAEMKYFRLTLWESFVALVERFCNFAVFTSAWQNVNIIVNCYDRQDIFLSEFKTIFLPLLPSFLMTNKDIRGMGNLVQQAIWPTLENGTSTGFGFLAYWYTLFRCSLTDFVVCFLIFIFCFLLTCSILRIFDNEDHDIKILYFLFLMNIANGASLSQLIGYSYIASLYLIVIMFLFGVIKIKIPFKHRLSRKGM